MKLGILVGHIKAKVDEYKALMQAPHTSQNARYELHQEMQVSFGDLEAALNTLDKQNKEHPELEATPEHAKVITDFFANRWNELIKSTNAYYLIEIKSSINLCCVLIAKYLAEQTNLVAPKNYLALLMPTVLSWENEKSHHDLSSLHRHTFILSDDNTRAIELGYLTEKFERQSRPHRLTLSHPVGGREVDLTKTECLRIYEHSTLMTTYYKAFMCDRDDRDLLVKNAKNEVIAALRDGDYAGKKVNSSYGQEGAQRLKENLLKRVNSLFVTPSQLYDFLAAKLSRKDWKDFIAKIDDATMLKLFSVDGKDLHESLSAIINDKATFVEPCIYNRAVLFCLVEVYWRDRKDKPEYLGNFSRFFGWSKTDKSSARDAIQTLLIDDAACGLDKKPLVVKKGEESVASPMTEGALGGIYKRMCEILNSPIPAQDEVQVLALKSATK